MPFISICIPAYNRIEHLRRLLDSLVIQNFKDFEVVATDDSDGGGVIDLCNEYGDRLVLRYYKNVRPLGTPENWNEAVRHANGQWIKIMHDDDWFSEPDSLKLFADAAQESGNDFIFSAFQNSSLNSGKKEIVRLSAFRNYFMRKNPVSLLSKNVIGPPSVTLYRKKSDIFFDRELKWLVDIDFYMRYLKTANATYIDRPLVTIGIHESQVTATSQLNKAVEIPEHLRLLVKTGNRSLHNIFFYDAFWRLFRNLRIKDPAEVSAYSTDGQPSAALVSMIRFQNKIAPGVLKIGVCSKLLMCINFLRNYMQS